MVEGRNLSTVIKDAPLLSREINGPAGAGSIQQLQPQWAILYLGEELEKADEKIQTAYWLIQK